jgi:hypothetical protein
VRCGGVCTRVVPFLSISVSYFNAYRNCDFNAGCDPGHRAHCNSGFYTFPNEPGFAYVRAVAFSVTTSISDSQGYRDFDAHLSADLDRYACADGHIGRDSQADSTSPGDSTTAGNDAPADGTIAGRHIQEPDRV